MEKQFGCPAVEISALKGTGVLHAAAIALQEARSRKPGLTPMRFPKDMETTLSEIENALSEKGAAFARWNAIKVFERDEKVLAELSLSAEEKERLFSLVDRVEAEQEDDAESLITSARYNYIAGIIDSCRIQKSDGKRSVTDRIDRIVTNRILAIPIFIAVMFLVYFVSVTTVGGWATDWTNDVLFGEYVPGFFSGLLERLGTAQWLNGLILDGIIGGVGAVLGFVPQMVVLFLFLAFLEACGYMSRVAFILDRIFRKFGLSGKSFIPMLIGTGCGIPGILASRTIESDRDRRMSIMTTTFMPCGAKLPIIALISGAMFGGAWWVAPSAYFVGIAATVVSGLILKKTRMFSGNPAPFVMELPEYRLPTIGNILRSVWERSSSFVRKAGTIILLSSIGVWLSFQFGVTDGRLGMVSDVENSLLAIASGKIALIFAPLGFGNWQATVATLTGLIAKENVVSTFGVLYGFGEVAENGSEIWGALAAAYTPLAAYSFLLFNLLCAPCFAAIGAIRREMNSAKWTWFAILYQTGFAYLTSLVVYQLGLFLTGGGLGVFTVAAFLILGLFFYLLLRQNPEKRKAKMNLIRNTDAGGR